MAEESRQYPEFRLRLPGGDDSERARGVLLDETGTNGSRKFLVKAGSPARDHVMPSLGKHFKAPARRREELKAQGLLLPSSRWPGRLELTRDVVFGSPSFAAVVLVGAPRNGWEEWRTEDDRPLSDFMPRWTAGPNRPWLVRGSNVTGLDLVRRAWLPDGRVTLAASRLRQGVRPGISKDELRTLVQEDYESTATYSQRQQLLDDLHASCRA